MKNNLFIIVILVCFAISGCAGTKIERSEPITLSEGLKEIIVALNEMAKVQSEKKLGLVPEEATVDFNVTAGKKDGKTGGIEIVPTGIVQEISKFSMGWSSEITESRGNTITIKLKSILFSKDDELVSSKTAKEILQKINELQEGGMVIREDRKKNGPPER